VNIWPEASCTQETRKRRNFPWVDARQAGAAVNRVRDTFASADRIAVDVEGGPKKRLGRFATQGEFEVREALLGVAKL